MTEKYTLNVGSGERTFKEYPKGSGFSCINYDERHLSGLTDVVGSVKNLPWENEYFEYILASDIIEHFPIAETVDILKEWRRVLKVNGIIEFRLPNLEAICKQYFDGGKNAKNISWLLYGGQNYPGNFHYVGFNRKFFREVCHSVGFKELTYKEEGFNMIVCYRRNGDE